MERNGCAHGFASGICFCDEAGSSGQGQMCSSPECGLGCGCDSRPGAGNVAFGRHWGRGECSAASEGSANKESANKSSAKLGSASQSSATISSREPLAHKGSATSEGSADNGSAKVGAGEPFVVAFGRQ